MYKLYVLYTHRVCFSLDISQFLSFTFGIKLTNFDFNKICPKDFIFCVNLGLHPILHITDFLKGWVYENWVYEIKRRYR